MTTARWLSPPEQRAWRAYLRMQSGLAAALNRQLQSACGLSLSDFDVLVRLSEADHGRLRPFQLEHDLQWQQSRLSHQLTRMQRRGLITRKECHEDRRGSYVTLTDAGRVAITLAAPAHVDAVRQLVFNRLTPDEVAQLERFSTHVLTELDRTAAAT